MKNTYKSILFIALAIVMTVFYTSCTKDKIASTPWISYVRITNPASADSLLASAGQGQLIAIVGGNLQDARQIWFNDQKATLTPTYITITSILVNVPTQVPISINNKLKIIFADGDSLLYNFTVSISKPVINSMDCEYVPDGGVATIHGNFFYPPLTVTFPGGAIGILPTVDATNQILKVVVPTGTQPGQITITTKFGATKSDFWFKDNRNIFISSDPWGGWSGLNFVVSNPGPTDPPAINGNYIRVKQSIGSWDWIELVNGLYTKNIPDDAILHPSLYYLKFELCTTLPYNSNGMRFVIGKADGNSGYYSWNPPYDTKGVWETVTIPFEDIMSSYTTPNIVIPSGYYTMIVFEGNGTLNCDMSFDNFRVVPKIIKP